MACLDNSCWPRRSICEKILIILNIILFILAVILAVYFIIYVKTRERICYSPQCTLSAARIIKTLNWSIDACDDFYEMTCGAKQKEKTFLIKTPSDYFESNIFFNRILLGAYENTKNSDLEFFSHPKNFFKICTEKRPSKADHQRKIRKVIGSPEKFNWITATEKARLEGYPYNQFVSTNIKAEPTDRNKVILVIGPPYYSDYSFKDDELDKSHPIIEIIKEKCQYIQYIGPTDILEAMKFTQKLMNISNPTTFKNMTSYTMDELDKHFAMSDSHSWRHIIGAKINNDIIYISDENYLKSLKDVIKSVKPNILHTYMYIRLILYSITFDIPYTESIFSECMKCTYSKFPILSSVMYFNEISNREKQHIKQQASALKYVIDRIIRTIVWMDSDTQKQAHKKYRKMKVTLGLNKKLLKQLDDYYENLTFDNSSYLNSFLLVNKYGMNYWLNILEEGGDIEEESLISSYYNVQDAGFLQGLNLFAIGAKFLQDVHYIMGRPQYMNFGAFGARISHFLVHGFDYYGKEYDFEGNQNKWWNEFTMDQYEKKAKCIIQQYGNFTDPSSQFQVDGFITKDENLADTSGVDIAYYSYVGWTRMFGQSFRLPGLSSLPNEKLYWITYASSFCQKLEYDPDEYLLSTKNFAPPKFRVNGALQNSLNFANDFKCEQNSSMRSKNPCQLFTAKPWFFLSKNKLADLFP